MSKSIKYSLLACFIAMWIVSCGEDKVYSPKPHMYPRVNYPARTYISFDKPDCPFTFQYPDYAVVTQDRYIFDDERSNDCWFNLKMPALQGTIYGSYVPVASEDAFNQIIADAFKIVGKHNAKANYREETVIDNGQGATGLAFDLKGPVATPYQFYLTDTVNHFYRASLYFDTQVAPDSMAPIHQYVIEDIQHIMDTWQWR